MSNFISYLVYCLTQNDNFKPNVFNKQIDKFSYKTLQQLPVSDKHNFYELDSLQPKMNCLIRKSIESQSNGWTTVVAGLKKTNEKNVEDVNTDVDHTIHDLSSDESSTDDGDTNEVYPSVPTTIELIKTYNSKGYLTFSFINKQRNK